MKITRRATLAALFAALTVVAGVALVASPAGANEDQRGECRYLTDTDQIELIDMGTVAKRISLRRSGTWVRTIDGDQTIFRAPFGATGGDYIARVFPIDGDRYDVPCEQTTQRSNRTFCTVTFGDDAQLRFPGIDDARRIIVRTDAGWQATLPADAGRWTDPTPDPNAQYFVRVRENAGGFTDIVCTPELTRGEQGNLGEITNGGLSPVGLLPRSADSDFPSLDALAPTVSDDGTTALEIRSNGNIRVQEFDGDALVSDRWLLREPDLERLTISGSGQFAIIGRKAGTQVELVRVNLNTREATPFAIVDDVFSMEVDTAASVVAVREERADESVLVIDVSSGDESRIALTPGLTVEQPFFNTLAKLSGDGTTLVLGQNCYGICPVEVIDLDSGDRRVFTGGESTLFAVNEDGTRILLTEDEGEDYWVLDIDSRDLTPLPFDFRF